MKRAIVIGSGAGGATAALELQGAFDVMVLEAGREFRRFKVKNRALDRWKRLGIRLDVGWVQRLFPAMRIARTEDMVLVSGKGLGGTTTVSAGNALRLDDDFKAMGINLDPEFEDVGRQITVSSAHRDRWGPTARRLYQVCEEMGLGPQVTPKLGDYSGCKHCGRCILGCPYGVKWDSRAFLNVAQHRGARLVTGAAVERVVIRDGRAAGVEVRPRLGRREFIPADIVVLAAGGLGTPPVLERSGIRGEPRLFVDPVLTLAAEWPGARLDTEVTMPFIVDKGKYIISPYFDFLSYFIDPRWRAPSRDILSVMIKLADEPAGEAGAKGIRKSLSPDDKTRLAEAVDLTTEIMVRTGVRKERILPGLVNAGHPGGMFPLTPDEKDTFHSPALPPNVYIADASLFPDSLGKPPILTIIALAKRVSRVCRARLA
ncbi:MAG: choline dehydrogenase [Candidatus Aminicenantes bacterium RBG_16_63_16]|nr:MAG: choline dehydrogenase [Candidatus Aminicenantes bacterium RBG_16_63_16]